MAGGGATPLSSQSLRLAGARVQILKLVGSDIMVEKRDDELISGYRGTSSPGSARGSHGFSVEFEAKGARERAFIRKSCS